MKTLQSRAVPSTQEKEGTEYPCLMESKSWKGNIYLMTSPRDGTRIASCNTDTNPLGEVFTTFPTSRLKPYNGTIQLGME